MMSPFSWSNAISTAPQLWVRNSFYERNALGAVSPGGIDAPTGFVLPFSGEIDLHPERRPVNVLTAIPFIGLLAALPLRFVSILLA